MMEYKVTWTKGVDKALNKRLNRAYRAIYVEHAGGKIQIVEVIEVSKHEY